jgi:hypothetical protein
MEGKKKIKNEFFSGNTMNAVPLILRLGSREKSMVNFLPRAKNLVPNKQEDMWS